MSTDDVRHSIASLRAEILKLDEDEETSREGLNAIVDRLESRVNAKESSEVVTTEDGNAVLQMVADYEARHPRLTAMVNDLTTRLMGMGI